MSRDIKLSRDLVRQYAAQWRERVADRLDRPLIHNNLDNTDKIPQYGQNGHPPLLNAGGRDCILPPKIFFLNKDLY